MRSAASRSGSGRRAAQAVKISSNHRGRSKRSRTRAARETAARRTRARAAVHRLPTSGSMPYPNAGVDSKPASTKRIRFPFLPAGLFALLLLAVYADPLFARRNFVGRDLIAFGLPMEKMVHDAWSRGRLPVWSEDPSGGRPLLANPSSGSLYPMRPLLSRLPFPWAMRVFPVAQWFLGGLGMLLALRALGASAAGGWIAAATFVFSGVAISLVCYLPNLPAATLLPWVLWAAAR